MELAHMLEPALLSPSPAPVRLLSSVMRRLVRCGRAVPCRAGQLGWLRWLRRAAGEGLGSEGGCSVQLRTPCR